MLLEAFWWLTCTLCRIHEIRGLVHGTVIENCAHRKIQNNHYRGVLFFNERCSTLEKTSAALPSILYKTMQTFYFLYKYSWPGFFFACCSARVDRLKGDSKQTVFPKLDGACCVLFGRTGFVLNLAGFSLSFLYDHFLLSGRAFVLARY